MLTEAQAWSNRQQKCTTRLAFATLLQNDLNSDVARFTYTTHESNLSCNKSGSCRK